MTRLMSKLNIGVKMASGYAIIIFFSAVLLCINLAVILNMDKFYMSLQDGAIGSNQLTFHISTEYANAQQFLLTSVISYSNRNDEYKADLNSLDKSIKKIDQLNDSLVKNISSDKNISETEKKQVMEMVNSLIAMITKDFVALRNEFETITSNYDYPTGDISKQINEIVAKTSSISEDIKGKTNHIIELTSENMKNTTEQNSASTSRILLFLSILAVVVLGISVILSILITNSIKRPLTELSKSASQITKGRLDTVIKVESKDEIGKLADYIKEIVEVFSLLVNSINNAYEQLLTGKLDVSIDEGLFQGDYKKVVTAVNNTVQYIEGSTFSAVQCAKAYANGNFETMAKRYKGEQALLCEVFDDLQHNLKSLSSDINKLIINAVEGNFEDKIDSSRYEGDWRNISIGLNSLLESVDAPLKEVYTVMEHVSAGNFSALVTGDYKGNYALMKNAINKTVENSKVYITDISDILVKMSEQNLDITITKDYVGDYAIIKGALTQIIRTFNKVISEFIVSADQVAISAKQISESSMALSQGAVEQASAIEETAVTAELISRQTAVNEKNSEEVRILSIDAKNRGLESKTDMEEMLKSMSDIRTASSDISKIINVIDDISFQINLLALNANIEAARAGVYGKGFSVVAEEVRNLAGKSKQAASETAGLINHTVEIVTNGTNIANNTSDSLNKMVDKISNIAVLINKISDSSKEQSSAVKKINESIAQISEVTQLNTATSEESASMSEELTSQADTLRDVLSNFNYKL